MNVVLRLTEAAVEFLWWSGWCGFHSHFHVQPNYSAVLRLCCVVVGVVTILFMQILSSHSNSLSSLSCYCFLPAKLVMTLLFQCRCLWLVILLLSLYKTSRVFSFSVPNQSCHCSVHYVSPNPAYLHHILLFKSCFQFCKKLFVMKSAKLAIQTIYLIHTVSTWSCTSTLLG